MIGALCESPLTFEALTVWRDELNEGKVLLRDIIDLEAMYGAGPEGQAAGRRCGRRRMPLGRRRASRCRRRCTSGCANGAAARAVERRNPHRRRRRPKPAQPMAKTVDPGEAAAAADGRAATTTISTTRAICRSPRWKPRSSRRCSETLDQIANLYKKLGKLQDAQRRSRARRRRTFDQPGTPLQEAAQRDRRSGQGPQAQQQPHRSARRSDVRHQPPSGVARRPPAAPRRSAWRRRARIS